MYNLSLNSDNEYTNNTAHNPSEEPNNGPDKNF